MNKEIVTKFEKIEEELKLFDLEYEGIPIWEIVRFGVFSKINNEINKRDYIFSDKFIIRKNIFKILCNSLKSFYQLGMVAQSDILVLNHPRRFNIEGGDYDIYTDTFLQKLPYSYVVFENIFQLAHSKNIITDKLYYLDYYKIAARIYSKLFKIKMNYNIKNTILTFEKKIFEIWNLRINILPYINREITRFVMLRNDFKKLILKVKPKMIIEVVNYNRPNKVFNYLAKEMGILIIELQHGTMGQYHLGYSFPNFVKNKLKTFPDYIFVWGNFWKEKTRFPIDKDKILITGFPYLEQKTNQINFDDNRKDILVISQPTIAAELCKEVSKLSDFLEDEDITIYYKLHPGEIENSHDRFQELYSRENIEVIDTPSITVYDLFPKCKVQIGVYSTALIEGIAFGLMTVILKLPGWEYFEEFQNNNNFIFLDSTDKIEMSVLFSNVINYNSNSHFWASNAMNSILLNIDKLMKDIK